MRQVLNRTGGDSVYGQQQLLHSGVSQRVDYYFWSCLFFLLGIVADFVTGHYGNADPYVGAYEYAW